MNKAFVREPEQGVERCPRCGSLGQSVPEETLAAHLSPPARRQLAAVASFCPFPRCEVVYFDSLERVVTTAEIPHPVYPKDPAAPICACFGLTTDDIERDVAEGVVTRTRAAVEQAKSEAAQCAVRAASGRSCVAQVQQYYMKCRQGSA